MAVRPNPSLLRVLDVCAAGVFLLLVTAAILGGASMTPHSNATLRSAPSDYTYGQGYALVGSDGGLYAYGTQGFYGSEGGHQLNAPVVGVAETPGGAGYWLVASDGGIFSFGNAQFHGSMGGQHINAPMVGMASTPDGGGYWTVGSDGGIYAFGDAPFEGSMGGQHLNAPVVGMASAADGKGYWLVGSDGGIYAYGDAVFDGSMGGQHLNAPVVGMAALPSGSGYWLVGSDGGIYSFGSAQFFGSPAATGLPKPIVGIASSPDGGGYWETASDGALLQYGDAAFDGAILVGPGGPTLGGPIVGMSSVPAAWPLPTGVRESGSPTVVANSDGRLEAFILGSDCQIYHTWQSTSGAGSAWNPWVSLGGCGSSNPIAVRGPDGTVQVFVLGGNGNIWHSWETSPGSDSSFSGWYDTSWGMVSGTQMASIYEQNGMPDIFFEAGNDCVWHGWETGTPSTYTGAYPISNACQETSDPAVGQNANGELTMFFRGGNGQIWQSTESSVNGPGGWNGPYPTPASTIAGTDMSVVRNANSELTVYSTAANNAVWWEQEQGPNTWANWVGAYPVTNANEQSGIGLGETPIGVANQDGHLDLSFVATNAELWYSFESAPGNNSYAGPYPLNENPSTGTYPSTLLDADGRIVTVDNGPYSVPLISYETAANSNNYVSWQVIY